MRTLALVLMLASGCTGESHSIGPWLDWPADADERFEGGFLRQAICEDLAADRVRIRVDAEYDIVPGAIDDEFYVYASFAVDPSIFDGEAHEIRGSLDVPDFVRDPDEPGIVFTPEAGHDPAIHDAIVIPWTIWDSPAAGRFQITGTLRVADPCPTGSMQVRAEGDTLMGGSVEAFMPFEPRVWRPGP